MSGYALPPVIPPNLAALQAIQFRCVEPVPTHIRDTLRWSLRRATRRAASGPRVTSAPPVVTLRRWLQYVVERSS